MFSVGNGYLEVEKKLIRVFRENFRLSHGREYFEIPQTDISKAKVLFLETCISASDSKDSTDANIFEQYKFTKQTTDTSQDHLKPKTCRPEHVDPYYLFDRFRFVPK